MNTLSFSIRAGRHRLLSGVVILATIVLSAWCAPSAFAGTSAPSFIQNAFYYTAYATRVSMGAEPGIVSGGLQTEWKAEYSTSCAGPWTEVSSGSGKGDEVDIGEIYIGGREQQFLSGEVPRWLRGLTPDESYCVRFTAKNSDGEATPEVIPFKTLPVSKPEVDNIGSPGHPRPQFVIASEFEDVIPTGATGAEFTAAVESNGAETTYAFEYAPAESGGGRPVEGSASWKPFTGDATGTISVASEHVAVNASLAGLAPETTYYVRLKMRNSAGETVQTKYGAGGLESFTTTASVAIGKPQVSGVEVRNHTSDLARVVGYVAPYGSETHWRFEYATSAIGPWTAVPGGEGTIPQAQAEATRHTAYGSIRVGATITGLSAAEKYFVRLFAENAAGEGEYCHSSPEICEAISVQTTGLGTFETVGPPLARTFVVHGLVGESLQLNGDVDPKGTPTSAEQTITLEGPPTGGTFTLTFNGHTTWPIAYNAPASEASAGSVAEALRGIGLVGIQVEGAPGGPYTIAFQSSYTGLSEPQIEANGSALTPSGNATTVTDLKGGETTETYYRFEYVSQASFAEHGWNGAEMTPEVATPASDSAEVVNAVLPALTAGETYRYRVLATSSIVGVGVVEGAEQSLTVPSFTVQPVSCPNEAFRSGLSAHLPDCRAYEQVSPVEKTGSQEPWQYGVELGSNLMVGAEGDNALLEATTVNWGVGAGAGGSPYLFSRKAGHNWDMTAGSPQPETGVDNDLPQIYSEDVTQVALEAGYSPTPSTESPNIEYKVGPVGGPYTTVATVPREPEPNEQGKEGWVAANGSLSKLVLQTKDRVLSGEPTGTSSGSDLYEYTAQDGLRQLNVSGESDVTIGSCGAKVVDGADEKVPDGASDGVVSGPHTVSADGSRVFFEAIPSKNCSEPTNLYMRMNGQETVDIGAYKFMGANAQGTTVLIENAAHELLAYDVETEATVPQSAGEEESAQELGALGFPDRVEAGEGAEPFAHPRYTYWDPGQVYRYDSVEHLVQCVSCASPFDPDPKQPAFLSSNSGAGMHGGVQELSTSSANGEFDFFTTPAPLVPQDVDGEMEIESNLTGEYEDVAKTTTPSSDVYEWREAGVDGCAHVQGCLALITNGRGGYKNMLLRTADEGNDVFIYTRSTLLAQTGRPEGSLGEGNIYDVRVDGGLTPVPPRPTECEGDACSTPPAAPNDSTPSSLTFSGYGNVVPSSGQAGVKGAKSKGKMAKPKAKAKKKGKGKGKKRGKKAVKGHGSRSKARGSMGTNGGTGR